MSGLRAVKPERAGDVEVALRDCRDITRRRARNFYYGLKLLPEPQRSAMYAVYCWMRRADDLVDGESLDGDAAARVEAFRRNTDRTLSGDPPQDDPLWTALDAVVQRFGLDAEPLEAMLRGQLDDVNDRHYETFDDLREYCSRVASSVGLVCINLWGYTDPRARDLAVERGIAFQLTNILRDFAQDFDHGRVYLPAEDFRRHRLRPDELRRWRRPHECAAFVREQAARAGACYQRSAALDGMITPSCRPTLWAMTEIYRTLLEKIIARPQRIALGPRVRLGVLSKTLIALRARNHRGGAVTPE